MKDLKEAAKRIYLKTVNCLDLEKVIRDKIKVVGDTLIVGKERVHLPNFKEVVLVGLGKASIRMGAVIESILKSHIKKGLLVTNRRSNIRVESQVIVAGHPLPDINSVKAGKEILRIIDSCDSESLIIFLISGGGSSLVEVPILDQVTVEDIQNLNHLLINCGATIREINVVRKHLSLIKGGRLGFLARKCKCIALFVSDVNEGDLMSIASNPFLPDEVAREEFFYIIEKYKLLNKLPDSVSRAIIDKLIPEVPIGWGRESQTPLSLLLLENKDAISATGKIAEEDGFIVQVDSNYAEGNYQEIADNLIKRLLNFQGANPHARLCIVSGGEVSCPVQGTGLGGRNQEFVLYSAAQLAISGLEATAVLSCGTDGIDGNNFATGAVADPQMIRDAKRRGLDVSQLLQTNDSHSFFQEMGGMIVTGPTENNVRDLRVLLAQ